MKIKRINIFEPRWLLVFVFFLAGFFLGGITLYIWAGLNTGAVFKNHLNSSNYKYINPILTVENNQNRFSSVNTSLQLSVESLINKHKSSGDIFSAAIYFRDLEPGYWVGINDADKFSPGKLLKLPIMMAYYKLAESNPEILDKKITYQKNNTNNLTLLENKSNLKAGEDYTVDELIKNMIVYSDDNSANLLFDNIDNNYLNEVFSDLGIGFKEEIKTDDFISLKLYSIFFRVLYNASYLSRDYSEKALSLLVEADDDFGSAASLPKSLSTANRYGARAYTENDKKNIEMYDCNLVYYPQHPYLACAIAHGDNLDNIQRFFSELGEKIYKEVYFRYQ